MGIGVDWKTLLGRNPAMQRVLPTDTTWRGDLSLPKFGAVLCDQTATMQQMNFAGSGQIITTGDEFERRIVQKFLKDNTTYGAGHIVLLWDKPWPSVRRAEMYAQKRYTVPAAEKDLPPGKIRGFDGRFYAPAQVPLAPFNTETQLGVKPDQVITASRMYPLPQLLNAAWTKVQVAVFMCRVLWKFAQTRDEHVVFDTPYLAGDPLCDGQMKCNKSDCVLCPDANIPRHAEADVLFLFHIRHLAGLMSEKEFFMVRGSNDRDLLVVLSCPFDQGLTDRIWWCKGSGSYAMSPQGTWVAPGKLTGQPLPCHEYIVLKEFVRLLGRTHLLSKLFLLFFFGADYCETPKGLTSTGLFKAFFECQLAIVEQKNSSTLHVSLTELHKFIQLARDGSQRCRTQLNAENLLKSALDAFYSLAYYTAFHAEFAPKTVDAGVGPDLNQFGYGSEGYAPAPELTALFAPMLRPILASATSSNQLVYSF